MADCVNLEGCIFFHDKMKDMPGTSQIYKKKYCQGDSTACARFMVCDALGKGSVPDDLFPNQTDRATKIIG